MNIISHKARQTADHISPKLDHPPLAGLLTGTGLSDTLPSLKVIQAFDYGELPHFPKTTVKSHRGRLIYGMLAGKSILVFQGRFHLYEGYSPEQVTFPVRLLQALKVPNLILTNAAGGINLDFAAGDIMLIKDHINLTGRNPLIGPEDSASGIRFPDMAQAYDKGLMALAGKVAAKKGLVLQEGIYAGLSGPSLETPAETKFLKTIGGDAVGFSTVMEAIAGVHAGMKILGLSLITNINNPDAPEKTTLEAVVETARRSSPKLTLLLEEIIPQLS